MSFSNQKSSATEERRNANLDLLRAGAIIMVIIFHVYQQWPHHQETLVRFTDLGHYGVDLFFVLSGWLIGGLYWREAKKFGDVATIRFLLRRSLRTVPPYLIMLLVYWSGVHHVEGTPWDWKFIFFLQNYSLEIPFFLISWSLCVEEHFYLILPFFLFLFKKRYDRLNTALILLLLVPITLRYFSLNQYLHSPFGYYQTATHLRFEGLIMGILISRLFYYHEDIWQQLKKWCKLLWVPALLLFCSLPFFSAGFNYVVGYSLVSIIFSILLVHLVDRKAVIPSRIIYQVARTSYSTYLTHALVIRFVLPLMSRYPGTPEFIWGLVLICAIFAVGNGYFYLVENPSLLIRDRLAPKRPVLQSQPMSTSSQVNTSSVT